MKNNFFLVTITALLTGAAVFFFTTKQAAPTPIIPNVAVRMESGAMVMTPSSGDLLSQMFPDKHFTYCVQVPDGDWIELGIPANPEPSATSSATTRDEYLREHFADNQNNFAIFEDACPPPGRGFGGPVDPAPATTTVKTGDAVCVVRPDGDFMQLGIPETLTKTATNSAVTADEYIIEHFSNYKDSYQTFPTQCPSPTQK
jgi:hypothetical protein